MAEAVLEAVDLEISIRDDHGLWTAVSDMALSVRGGRTLCIVGESGCGKSLTALSLIGLLPGGVTVTAGSVRLGGEDLLTLPLSRLEDLRGERVAMIFQEPLTALNPVLSIGEQIAEAVRRHRGTGGRAAMARALEVLRMVQMPDPERRARQYLHQLSGGMRQRAMIAMALSCDPQVILADEPTTALDVTVQAQILGLLADLQRRTGAALVLITHDLGVVAEVADHVIVMYAGRRVETGWVLDIFDAPQHPYTRGLMGAVARAGVERLADIPGTVPPLWNLRAGCAFAPRCPGASARCRAERPPLTENRPGHFAACWVHDDG